jgi:hypothetical protein
MCILAPCTPPAIGAPCRQPFTRLCAEYPCQIAVRRLLSNVQAERLKGSRDDSVRLVNRRAFGVPLPGAQSMSTRPKYDDFDGAGSDLENALTCILGDGLCMSVRRV